MRTLRRGLCVAALLGGGALTGGLGHALPALAAGGHHYFVAPGGTGTCASNAPNKPFGMIQDALDCAAGDSTTPTNRDYIHIAAGNYMENLDIEAHVTLLGAGQSSTVINGGDNTTTIDNDGETVTMNQLTITNGDGFVGGGINNHAGGVMTLTNLTVSGNDAAYGGGIDNSDSTITLINSTVTHNNAYYSLPGFGGAGGGIENDDGMLTVINTTVSHNMADYEGAGIDNYDSTARITNSPVTANQTGNTGLGVYGPGNGGGIWNNQGLTLTNSPVTFNMAFQSGGGIFNLGTITLTNNPVSYNQGFNGGGIYNGGTATLTNSNVIGNSLGQGGDGGGIDNYQATSLKVTGGKISGNGLDLADEGGGIWTDGVAPVTLKSVSVTNNTVLGDGGGVYDNADESCVTGITMTSTTITGNTPDQCS